MYRLTGLRPSSRAQLRQAQMEAASVWMLCRDLHLSARQNRTPWPTQVVDFLQATKGRFALHRQTAQAIFRNFLGNVETTRERRKTDPTLRHPYKDKRYYPLSWPAQAVGAEREPIARPKGRGRQWRCRNPECSFQGHRDVVGSANMHTVAFGAKIDFPAQVTISGPVPSGFSGGINSPRWWTPAGTL